MSAKVALCVCVTVTVVFGASSRPMEMMAMGLAMEILTFYHQEVSGSTRRSQLFNLLRTFVQQRGDTQY